MSAIPERVGGETESTPAQRHRLAILDANSYWTEQIFGACAPRFEVLLMKPRDLRAHFHHHRSIRGDRTPRLLRDGLYEQRFGFLPGWMFARWRYSENRLASSIERFADANPMVLAFNYPQYCSLLERVPHRLSIYYNTDDYTNHWRGHEDEVQVWERDAVYGADITVCIAAYRCGQLKERYPERADRIHHVPIGCSPGFMVEQPLHEPKPLTGSLSGMRRPVVGYIGALNWRFDFEFLDRVASGLPDITFALGGSIPDRRDGDAAWWRALEACRRRSNVRFLGPARHEDVGRCLQSFDALMMMYSDTPVNRCACPAKLWDYLGTSLPIVANDVVPEVARWREAVYLSETAADFSENLVTALGEDRDVHGSRRLAIAREHTWPRLGERLVEIIDARLSGDMP